MKATRMQRSSGYPALLMGALKLRAKAQGLTQDELARRLKVSLPTLKRWLAGQTVTLDSVKRLCDALGVSVGEIAREVDDTAPTQVSYSLEQEEFLSLNPDALAFFDFLVQGRSVTHSNRAKSFGVFVLLKPFRWPLDRYLKS